MFDVVIFDWDGTLADTKDVIVLSFQKVLKAIGCTVSDEHLEKQIGIGAKYMFKDALKMSGVSFSKENLDELVERKNKMHIKLASGIELFDGVLDLLDSLHNKVKLALATMSNRKVINKLLEEKGIKDYFDCVITADEVQLPKPNPEVFLRCTVNLHCKPERCVVVEDSIFGVIAAKKANMKCIGIPSGSYSRKDLEQEGADLVVNSLDEKRRILEFIIRN